MTNLLSHARTRTALAIVFTAAIVVALAIIQYRWNQEASDATGVRLADSLQLSMINWHLDLFRNLSEVGLTLRMPVDDAGAATSSSTPDRLEEWRSLARYPELVANVYIVRRTDARPCHVVRAGARIRRSLDRASWPQRRRARRELARRRDGSVVRPSPRPGERQLTESFYNIGSALRVWRFDPVPRRSCDRRCRTANGCSSS